MKSIIVTIALLALSLTGMAKADQLPDSLLTEDYVYYYMLTDTEKAERIMKELRARKLYPQWDLDYVEGDLYYNTNRSRLALKYYNAALASKHARENDTVYMALLHRQISCYDKMHDEVEKSRCVKALLDKAIACGDKAMHSVALFNMGKSLYYQGGKAKGYRMMEEAAQMMEKTDYDLKYDNLRYNYSALATFRELDGMYEKALEAIDAWEALLTRETGDEKEMDGLTLRGMKDIYAHRAIVLLRLGKTQEAAEYYKKFKSLDKSLKQDNYLIAPYLFFTQQYEEVLRLNLPREEYLRQQGDTVNYYMVSILKQLGGAYRRMGDYRKSSYYFARLSTLRDSLKVREQRSSAQELAAIYHEHEQELEIVDQKQKTTIATVFAVFLLVLLASAVVFSVIFYRKNKAIKRKNSVLADHVKLLIGYKSEVLTQLGEVIALRNQVSQLTQAADSAADAGEKRPVSPARTTTVDAGNEADRSLYDRVKYEIESKQLYLDKEFSKDALIREMRIPVNKFARLFTTFDGKPFNDYVQDLRLVYAAKLLGENGAWTIEGVAEMCGMSRRTFHRLFVKKYGVTPQTYQKEGANHQEGEGEKG